MGLVIQQLINGIVVGSAYALVALGFSLVYGVIRLINFAQVSLYTVGAYIAWGLMPIVLHQLAPHHGWFLFVLVILAAGLLTGLIGMLVGMIAWWPIRQAPVFSQLVSSLGILILIENIIQVFISALPQATAPPIPDHNFLLLGAHVNTLQIGTLVMALGLSLSVYFLVKRSKFGRAVRAVASDPMGARLFGVNSTWIILTVFGIAAFLAGVSGVIISNTYGVLSFDMGLTIGLKGFAAAVLGGMGNIWGAVVGGLSLGIIEGLSTFVLPSQWTDAVAFIVLIIVLAVRPTGILRSRVTERA